MNTYNLTLDLAKAKQRQQQTIFVRQGDKSGTTIRATITDHGVAANTSGMTARFSMRLPNGTEYYRKTATLSGSTATVTIDEAQAASAAGRTDVAYFQLLQGTDVIASTESFTVIVLPDALADATVPESYDSAIQEAIDALDEATGRISQMVIDATAEYLEAHPEITTTVQDNSLDDDKLIQKGGILQREQWLETMLPNIPRKATSEAGVHSVTDSAGGGPLGISVYGRSMQDGTPTPDAPVAIQSVEPDADGGVKLVAQRTSNTSQAVTIPIDLGGRSLRSLPDGTRDEVTVDEWGHAVLTQRVLASPLSNSDYIGATILSSGLCKITQDMRPLWGALARPMNALMSDVFKVVDGVAYAENMAATIEFGGGNTRYLTLFLDPSTTGVKGVATYKTWAAEHPYVLQSSLAEPQTIDLGYLDPSLLPAPDLTAYVVPSAPSVLRYGFDVAQALAEITTA